MAYEPAPSGTSVDNDVAYLIATFADGTYWQGTGFLIAPNYVLTAAHMVDNATSVEI